MKKSLQVVIVLVVVIVIIAFVVHHVDFGGFMKSMHGG